MMMSKASKRTRKRATTAKKRRTSRKKVERTSPRESFLTTGPVIEVREEHRLAPADLDMDDHGLWGRAKTQWMLGDWDSLASLELSHLEQVPHRAELAALSACAQLQKGDKQSARKSLAAASRWNCAPAFMVRALVAGSEASLARYHEICGHDEKSLQLLASSAGALGGDGRLAAMARKAIDSATSTCQHPKNLQQTLDSDTANLRPSDQPHYACEKHGLCLEEGIESDSPQPSDPYTITSIFQLLIVEDGRIPTSLSSTLARRIAELRSLHPEASYQLLGGTQIRAFLTLHFKPAVSAAYDSLRPYAYKADLVRYCLLYMYGGMYVDLSISVKKRYSIPANYSIACFREPEVSSGSTCGINNGLIYARPRRKEFAIAIHMILANCHAKYYGVNALAPTGPILFGRAIALADTLEFIYCGQTYISEQQTAYFADPLGDVVAESAKVGGSDNSSWNAGKTNSYNDLWSTKNVYANS